jgi:hypothetical protein
VETDECGGIEFSVSDYAELGSLQEFLGWTPDVRILRIAGRPDAGEQGALDVLTVLAGSSGLVAALKVIPEFLRSRRTGLLITTTVKGKQFTLDATNVDDIMPILERLLDD